MAFYIPAVLRHEWKVRICTASSLLLSLPHYASVTIQFQCVLTFPSRYNSKLCYRSFLPLRIGTNKKPNLLKQLSYSWHEMINVDASPRYKVEYVFKSNISTGVTLFIMLSLPYTYIITKIFVFVKYLGQDLNLYLTD